MEELKPCPFCGHKAMIVEIDTSNLVKDDVCEFDKHYRVVCTSCPADLGRLWCWKKEAVVRLWNRRAKEGGQE